MTFRPLILALGALSLLAAAPSVSEAAPRCDPRPSTFRHTDGDGHAHTMGPEHAGHRHGEKTRNFKGYALKPRCAAPDAASPAPRTIRSSRS